MSEAMPLFVYGTLQTGESRAGVLSGLRRRPATIRGRLFHLPAGYPAVVIGGGDVVHGQLVDPPGDRLLAMLDMVEGVGDGLYRREVVPVSVGLQTVHAWVYVTDESRVAAGRPLPHGRWQSVSRR